MNRVTISGRLVADPELKTYGKKDDGVIVRLTVADDDRSGKEVHTNFHRIVAFGKLGETIDQFFSKGDQIIIFGKIKTDSYEKDNGDKVYTNDIIMMDFEFGAKSKNNSDDEKESRSKRRGR